MENTSNYGLKRWDGEDRILHTEFNDNWDKIDTALKSSADGVAALQTALAGAGNCEIGMISYTVTAEKACSNPTTVTFPKMPAGFLKPIPIPGPAPMGPTTPPPLPFRKNPQRCSFSDTTFLPC